MQKQLVIHLPASDDLEDNTDSVAGSHVPHASWQLHENNHPGPVFHGDLTQAVAQAGGARVSVLVPGDQVLLAQVELPDIKGSRMARAVPYALEDHLADDVDEVHVALGKRDAIGRIANAVVSRERLEFWLTQLREAGLHPDVVSPEVFGIYWSGEGRSEGWSLLVDDRQAIMRTGSQMGLASRLDNLATVLKVALDSSGDILPDSISVTACGGYRFEDTPTYTEIRDYCEQQGVTLKLQTASESCSELLMRGYRESSAINLLQGEFSRKGKLQKVFRPWRGAAILAAVWLVILLGLQMVEYFQLSRQQAELQSRVSTLFRETLPDSRLVPGQERLLMERQLAELRGHAGSGNGLLELLAGTGPVLQDFSNVKLRTLRYRAGKLEMDLELADLQTLDTLKQAFTDKAVLDVEIVSASSRNGIVESRLALSRSTRGGNP